MSDVTQEVAQATLSKRAYERRRQRLAVQQLLRGGAIACFFLCVMLFVAMIHLNRLPVREIVWEGNAHYSSEQLQELLPYQSGDPLHQIDVQVLRESLLSQCPYLADVQVEMSLRGVVKVTLRERHAMWALRYNTTGGTVGYALLDEELRALEYTGQDGGLCVVICPGVMVPRIGETLDQAAERGAQAYVDRMLEAGNKKSEIVVPPYQENAETLRERLFCIASGLVNEASGCAPVAVDFSAAYDYTLTLQDGSVLLLGNAQMLEQQIAYAMDAMEKYRREQGAYAVSTALMVDVQDISRVFVREIGVTP